MQCETLLEQIKIDAAIGIAIENKPAPISTLGSRGELAALERLVTAKGLSNPNEMLARKEAWADAHRHTPHGKPVDLPTHPASCRFDPFRAASIFRR